MSMGEEDNESTAIVAYWCQVGLHETDLVCHELRFVRNSTQSDFLSHVARPKQFDPTRLAHEQKTTIEHEI